MIPERFTVEFFNRDGSDRPPMALDMLYVSTYSRAALGGPKLAKISALGDVLTLWEFAEMLRCPVVIRDTLRQKAPWIGYIDEIDLYVDGQRINISIDSMANRIAVAYTLTQFRFTTTWEENAESIATYGTKELLLTARDMTDNQASDYRDTELSRRKYPAVSIPYPGQRGTQSAIITARGWWDTLDWTYYARADGIEAYEDLDRFSGREVGEDDRPILAQSFQNSSGSDWTAETIELRVRVTGAPADNLIVALYSDVAGDPGVSLATSTTAGGTFTNGFTWYTFTLSAGVLLTAGSTYWIHVSRSGGIDTDNYYVIDANIEAGYTLGEMKIYSTGSASWVSWPWTCDANFKVAGTQETSLQIQTAIEDAGQFFAGADITNASGVYTNQSRRGDNTTLYEILKLSDLGTSNARRTLARVLENRRVEIYQEPALNQADYSLDSQDIIRDSLGSIVPPAECPAGVWMRFEDIIPTSVNVSRLSNPAYTFVEEAEYNALTDTYRITRTRDLDTLRLAMGVSDG